MRVCRDLLLKNQLKKKRELEINENQADYGIEKEVEKIEKKSKRKVKMRTCMCECVSVIHGK